MSVFGFEQPGKPEPRRAEAAPGEKSLGDLLTALLLGLDAEGIEVVDGSVTAEGLDVYLGPHRVAIAIQSPLAVPVYSAPRVASKGVANVVS